LEAFSLKEGPKFMIKVKEGVLFTTISPAGFKLLSAFQRASDSLGMDFTITSACDGAHSGPGDPHHSGSAYDVRSQGITDKSAVLRAIMQELGVFTASSGGWVTDKFFGWLEQAGTPNEHFHFQLRHGVTL
jgi:hypothetical protein